MNILFVLIPLSLVLVVCAGWAFFWAVGNGQFDDLDCPAWEILTQDEDNPGSSRTPESSATAAHPANSSPPESPRDTRDPAAMLRTDDPQRS